MKPLLFCMSAAAIAQVNSIGIGRYPTWRLEDWHSVKVVGMGRWLQQLSAAAEVAATAMQQWY